MGIGQTAVLAKQQAELGYQTRDPTAHREILSIREACPELGTEHLARAAVYLGAHRIWRERNADAKGTTS